MEGFDVIVVGGGPAGMMAAGHAAECGRRVLLLEKNRAVGKKLGLTGGGRCNIGWTKSCCSSRRRRSADRWQSSCSSG